MTKTVIMKQVRTYKEDHTRSEVFLWDNPEKRFCYALEDVHREKGVKVYGETCIPEGLYDVDIVFSSKFKKWLMRLSNTPSGKIVGDGIEFSGVLIHGGNTVEDTLGCPLWGYQYLPSQKKILNRASDDAYKKVHDILSNGDKVKLLITSNKGV